MQLDESYRILLCTHSNRASDIHVELLDKYLKEQNGTPASTPLRVYQPMRRYLPVLTSKTVGLRILCPHAQYFTRASRASVVQKVDDMHNRYKSVFTE